MIIFCLLPLLLLADELTEKENIPGFLAEQSILMLNGNDPVLLQINAEEFTQQTTWLLKEELLKREFTITEDLHVESEMLKIDYQIERNIRKVKKFIFTGKQYTMIHRFSIQTTESSGKINDFRTLEYVTADSKAGKMMNWYDPIMISTIIGGLIYLFYYGNN